MKKILSISISTIMLLVLFSGCMDDEETDDFVTSIVPLEERTEVPCQVGENDFVILTFGQSNADNSISNITKTTTKKAFEIFKNKCYLIEDPNLGTQNGTGDIQTFGGSVWTILGDKIIEENLADNVYFINIAYGGSSVSSWNEGGTNYSYLNSTLEMLKDMNISLTHVFWHQGETDAMIGTTEEQYYDRFINIRNNIREYSEAPIFVAKATYCNNSINLSIVEAQTMLSSVNEDIFPGPNTDLINNDFRRPDKCHFNYYGGVLHANGWINSILEYNTIK